MPNNDLCSSVENYARRDFEENSNFDDVREETCGVTVHGAEEYQLVSRVVWSKGKFSTHNLPFC